MEEEEPLPMLRTGAIFAVACAMGCHLADSPEPPHCPPEAHVENNHCVADQVAPNLATIGPSCAITPDPLEVEAGADFQFKNADHVHHAVTGLDGKLSLQLDPGQLSPFVEVTRAGTFPYAVSDCPDGGTLVVQ